MFLVKTRVGASTIHGNGVFADEPLAKGQAIWQFAPDLDMFVSFERIAAAAPAFRAYMDMYAYVSPQFPGGMLLSCDHAKFLNHSDTPNTTIEGDTTYANKTIPTGEEITCDYRVFIADWSPDF